MPELNRLCDSVSFNTLSQWRQFQGLATGRISCGLRVNPRLSLVEDCRYNPCCPSSKLGEPLDRVQDALRNRPESLEGIDGLLVHTNCDCNEFEPLQRTVEHLVESLRAWLPRLSWLDLGGGYLYDHCSPESLETLLNLLRYRFEGQILFEPGAAIVRSAVILVAKVRDIFYCDSKAIAVLDTSVNHMPEVFEYQYEPDVAEDDPNGEHCYVLAGCTCLAGDILGEYCFTEPLQLGSRVVFLNIGAYSIVKAHMFNGINLPTIYEVDSNQHLKEQKRFRYSDFLSLCGGSNHEYP